MLTEAPPYLIVVSVAFVVGCAELIKTFGGNFFRALGSRWGWALVGVNAVVAVVVYVVARNVLNIGPGWFLAFCVGLLFPVLLRSRYTFFRPVGARDDPRITDLSIRVDEFYTALQERCYREVDNTLAVSRTLKAAALAEQYAEGPILRALNQVIAARQVATDREKDAKFVEELAAVADEGMRRFRLAVFLLEIAGGQAERLLKAPPPPSVPPGGPPT